MAANANIVFLGTAEFAVPILQALIENDQKPVLVITQPDQPAGRKQLLQAPPVKSAGRTVGIPVSQPESSQQLNALLRQAKPDVCILVAYGTLIKKEILAIPRFGFINIHPSLLPQYRGPAPIQKAILNGDEWSGVTVMLLDEQMDHGPTLAQEKLAVLPTDTAVTLADRLAVLATDLLLRTLPDYLAGALQPKAQDEARATYTSIITREDGLIQWSKPAEAIERQFRAFLPWPGVYTHWQGKRLKIVNLSVLEGNFKADGALGTVFLADKKGLAVKCGQGAVCLGRVQVEGKKEMSAAEFLRGYPRCVGSAFSVEQTG